MNKNIKMIFTFVALVAILGIVACIFLPYASVEDMSFSFLDFISSNSINQTTIEKLAAYFYAKKADPTLISISTISYACTILGAVLSLIFTCFTITDKFKNAAVAFGSITFVASIATMISSAMSFRSNNLKLSLGVGLIAMFVLSMVVVACLIAIRVYSTKKRA